MLESQDAEITDLDQRQAHVMAVLLALDIMGRGGEATLERLQAFTLDIMGQMRVPEEGRVELMTKVLTTPLYRYLLPDAPDMPLESLEIPWSQAERLGLTVVDDLLDAASLLRAKGHEPGSVVMADPRPIKTIIAHHTDGGRGDLCPECNQAAPGGMCMFCGWGTEEE